MTKRLTIGWRACIMSLGKGRTFYRILAMLGKLDAKVVLEYGYGSGMRFTEEDYLNHDQKVTFVSHEEVFKQDYVLVLRCPSENDLRLLKPGACIISMMHYPTRPIGLPFFAHWKLKASHWIRSRMM